MLKMLRNSILVSLVGVFLVGCVSYTLRPATIEQRAYAAILDLDYLLIAAQRYCIRPTSNDEDCKDMFRIGSVGASIADQTTLLLKAVPRDDTTIEANILDLAAIIIELESFLEE